MKFIAMHKSTNQQILFSILIAFIRFCPQIALAEENSQSDGNQTYNKAFGSPPLFEHPDKAFIASLLNLELYEQAVETCRNRRTLANSQTESVAQWSMLEMKCLAAKIGADPAIYDQPTLVTGRLLELNEIVESATESPRRLWLAYQLQWCHWYLLQRLQAAYLSVPARKEIREWSLAAIRRSVAELETLQQQIQTSPDRTLKPGSKPGPPPAQWIDLINDTHLLRTDLLLLRALYYPPESPERIAAATEMQTAIDNASLRMSLDWAGRPNVELARCKALILVNRSDSALMSLKSLKLQLEEPNRVSSGQKNDPGSNKVKQTNRWRIPIAVLAADANRQLGNLAESNRWLESIGGWTASPEAAIEHFANLVAFPASSALSENQLSTALNVKREIGLRFGSYWQQRADAILVSNNLLSSTASANSASSTTSTAPNLKVELLVSEAKQLLSAKRYDEGIDKLSQAEESAAGSGNERLALELAIQTAAVLTRGGQRERAEEEFHRAAFAYRGQAKAPDAAIMSVLNFDKIVRPGVSGSTKSPEIEAAELQQEIYLGRLRDIVSQWPESAQSQQAMRKLDRALIATDRLPEMLDLWSNRSPFDLAVSRFALVWAATQDAWFDHSIFSSKEFDAIANELAILKTKLQSDRVESVEDRFRSCVSMISDATRWPLRTSKEPIGFSIAPSSETPAVSNDPVSIVEFAMRWAQLELEWQRLVQSGSANALTQSESERFRSWVGELGTLENIVTELGEKTLQQWNRARQLYVASAKCWSGQEELGLSALEAARKQDSKNAWWLYRTARLLQSLKARRQPAIAMFRQMANGFPPGSEPWMEARARTVQTLRSLGQTADANALMELVLASYPAAKSEWQSRFQ